MDDLIKKLEQYKTGHQLTYAQLANRLQIPENYIFRWRKKGRITGIYKRIIEKFLMTGPGESDYQTLKNL
jgi:hypothetical protein